MNSILFWVGALVVVSLISPVLRLLVAAVAGKQIGEHALAKQPDSIHLERRNPGAWKNPGGASQLAQPLISRGFEDAGVHAVREMPGLHVQLLAHPADGFYAAVYEHPVAGNWLDVFTRFQDGTSFTVATSQSTGLAPRPGHTTLNVPGLTAAQALDKAVAERPRKWPETASVERVVDVFEKAYAEAMAWRKDAGISRGEVMKVAMRKKAA